MNRRVKTHTIRYYPQATTPYLWGFGYIYENGKLVASIEVCELKNTM